MRREVQKRDVEEINRYRPRIGADIEEQKIGTEEEIRIERQEIRTDQKDHIYKKEMIDYCLDT